MEATIQLLTRLTTIPAAKAVDECLNHPVPRVRLAALYYLCDRNLLRGPALLRHLDDADSAVQREVVAALGLAHDSASVAPLIGCLASVTDEPTRLEIVDALFVIGSLASPALKSALHSPIEVARSGARRAFSRITGKRQSLSSLRLLTIPPVVSDWRPSRN